MSAQSIWTSNRRQASKLGRLDAVRSAGPVLEALKTLIAAQPFFKGMKEEHEHFTARALETTEAILFYGSRLREQCEENHDLGYEMMSRMAVVMLHRIQATRCQLLACHAKRS